MIRTFLLMSLLMVFSNINLSSVVADEIPVIDEDVAIDLVEAYQLVKDRKRADSMNLISEVSLKLDRSVPLFGSVYKRLQRVKVNVRQREWFRAQIIFKKILVDLKLIESNEAIIKNTDCDNQHQENALKCEIEFGGCLTFSGVAESCGLILANCNHKANLVFDKCVITD